MSGMPTPDPPRYFPFMHGVYDVKAGIGALGREMGNGPLDALVFQLDGQFPAYRAAKLASGQHRDRHVLRDRFDASAEQAIARWAAARLAAEHPGDFTLSDASLACGRTDESIELEADPAPLDALAMQVQDDMAVLVIDEDGTNRLAWLHVSMPSGWPPEEKIGRPFAQVHTPVPHIDPINAKQDAIAKLMVSATRGAVRFAWTITTDAALNHHPHRDQRADTPAASPLPNHPAGEPLLRVERQVIWGFPEHAASLFLIRTYLYPFDTLDEQTRSALSAAVTGMSDASLRYKNMDRDQIVAKLT